MTTTRQVYNTHNMIRKFQLETQLGKTWINVATYARHTDALAALRERSVDTSERRYPMRIVRVVKTVVFEEKKS